MSDGAVFTPIDVIFDSTLAKTGQFGVTGTSDYPVFNVQPALKDITGFSLLWANVPFSYYVVDDTNNIITLRVATVNYTIELPYGTYNALNLITALQESTNQSGVPDPTNYVWYIDNTTSKLTLYNASNAFELIMDNSSPLQSLGYANATYSSVLQDLYDNSDVLIGNVNAVIAPRSINLTGPNQMFLHSSLSGLAHGVVRTQVDTGDLISFFPVNTNYQGIIERDVTFPQMIPVTKTDISQINFYLSIGNQTQYTLYNEDGSQTTVNYLPLNGEGFQICIRFYQIDKTNQFAKQTTSSDQPQSIYQGARGPSARNVKPRMN